MVAIRFLLDVLSRLSSFGICDAPIRTTFIWCLSFLGTFTGGCALAHAQAVIPSHIQPVHAYLAVGESQSFQLLDDSGEEIESCCWSVSDDDVADIRVDGKHAIVTAKSTGQLVLSSGDGAYAKVDIVSADSLENEPRERPRWILQPIDGEFVSVLWATGAWGGSAPDAEPPSENDPSYFYEDRGVKQAHLRAINELGLQVWQWPAPSSLEKPRLLCGDIYSGALLRIGDGRLTTLVDLDSSGQERWRIPAPSFSGRTFAYNFSGLLYFVEEDDTSLKATLVGVDAHTGSEVVSYQLPESSEKLRNLTVINGKLICSPGTQSSVRLPIHYSEMMSDFDNDSHLLYSELNMIADAGTCTAGTPFETGRVQIDADQKLVELDIYSNHSLATHVLEENVAKGNAMTTLIKSSVPTGDITFDEQNGIATFFAARTTTEYWRRPSSKKTEDFQYQIKKDVGVNYRFRVPGFGSKNIMMLGNQGLGFVVLGDTVTAFNAESGVETWRWQSKIGELSAYNTTDNGGLIVREGNHYTILKDGKPQEQLDETYVQFVKKFLPPKD